MEAIQFGLGLGNSGFKSMWLEIPGFCNLKCPYCYACGGKIKHPSFLLTWKMYESILNQAAELGCTSLGIPGAGEPFVEANRALTMKIVRHAASLGMFITVFTTGEFITPELADELYDLPVELMIKCNSLDPTVQDTFVSTPDDPIVGYGEKRNAALQMLMAKGVQRRIQVPGNVRPQVEVGLRDQHHDVR